VDYRLTSHKTAARYLKATAPKGSRIGLFGPVGPAENANLLLKKRP
jgi:hypothetical protein